MKHLEPADRTSARRLTRAAIRAPAVCVVLLSVALWLSACSGGDQQAGDTTAVATDGTDTTGTDTSGSETDTKNGETEGNGETGPLPTVEVATNIETTAVEIEGDFTIPETLPEADTGPEEVTANKIESGPPSKFKGCHGMSTGATLFRSLQPPRVVATTNIWSHCWIGGFTGTVAVLVGDDAQNTLAAVTPNESWAVQGLFEAFCCGGFSDRAITWTAEVDPGVIDAARTLEIVHTPAPRNRLVEILQQAVTLALSFLKVGTSVSALQPE